MSSRLGLLCSASYYHTRFGGRCCLTMGPAGPISPLSPFCPAAPCKTDNVVTPQPDQWPEALETPPSVILIRCWPSPQSCFNELWIRSYKTCLLELNISVCQFALAGGWQLGTKSVSNWKRFVTMQTRRGGTARRTSAAWVSQKCWLLTVWHM